MAKKSSSRSKSAPRAEEANVVRIKAGSTTPKKETPAKITKTKDIAKATAVASSAEKPAKKKRSNPFKAIGGYFKGAWFELRQVHWPTRRATWSLTFAVLVYTAFFAALILLLDAGFKALFEIILGK